MHFWVNSSWTQNKNFSCVHFWPNSTCKQNAKYIKCWFKQERAIPTPQVANVTWMRQQKIKWKFVCAMAQHMHYGVPFERKNWGLANFIHRQCRHFVTLASVLHCPPSFSWFIWMRVFLMPSWMPHQNVHGEFWCEYLSSSVDSTQPHLQLAWTLHVMFPSWRGLNTWWNGISLAVSQHMNFIMLAGFNCKPPAEILSSHLADAIGKCYNLQAENHWYCIDCS